MPLVVGETTPLRTLLLRLKNWVAGFGTVGEQLLAVETAASGRTVLGAGATGAAMFVSSTAASGRTVLGVGATGASMFIAGTAASGRTVLGAGATGGDVFVTGTAASARTVIGVRDTLTAARTYYVRTDGNDSNTGLANTAGGAKLTVQGALDAIAQIDFNGYTVTVQIADGTYAGAIDVPAMVGQASNESLRIVGNETTPANVVLDGTGEFTLFKVGFGAGCYLRDLKITGDARGLEARDGGKLRFRNIDFGAFSGSQIFGDANGVLESFNDYAITGAAARHYDLTSGARLLVEGEVTITGTPAFTIFADVDTTASASVGDATFTGSATGTRYSATLNGVINVAGGGANFFPGNAAGSTATGGQYV